MAATIASGAPVSAAKPAKPWYKVLYIQVLIAIALGALVGWLWPDLATNDWIKALGDGFIKLIKMVIAPIIFGNVVRPGAGFGGALADAGKVAGFAKQAEAQKTVDFFLHIIPDTVVGAFATGEILQVLLFSILFGFSIMALGERGHTIRAFI